MMVIGQMEVQLDRVKAKRAERIEAEIEASRLMGGKSKEIREGERKKIKLRREIEDMQLELEKTYNNNAVTKLEDEVKAEKQNLFQLF